MNLLKWCQENEKMILIKEWSTQNIHLPEEYACKSNKRVSWICKEGHSWTARIQDRVRGNGCPFCSGKKPEVGKTDLATLFPKLEKEWDYEKNKKKPQDYRPGSGVSVYWKCEKGHSWKARIYARTKRNEPTGCPYCAGQRVIPGVNDLESIAPDIAEQWDYERNKGLSPKDICANSGIKYWWKCAYGHSWRTTPNNRVSQDLGCPECSKHLKTSFPEQAIFFYAKKLFEHVSNRYLISSRMEIDIYIPEIKTGIEYDGIVFHSSKTVADLENKKNKLCESLGIRLIRVKECRTPKESSTDIVYRNVSDKNSLTEILSLLMEKLYVFTDKRCTINIKRDRNDILSQYIGIPLLETDNIDVIHQEWDYEKNGNITPEMISKGTHMKFWWKCSKGHSWQTSMYHKTDKSTSTGCPYCSGQKVLKGFNDLETLNPRLAAEWDYDANGDFLPDSITPNSGLKAYWKCKLGHSWSATISKRTNGQGCPYCSGKKVLRGFNDLATVNPALVLDWDFEKNTDISPYDVTKGCNKSVFWKCNSCGYEWKTRIADRSKGKGCKKCGIKSMLEKRAQRTR